MGYLVQLNCRGCGHKTSSIRFGITMRDRRIMGPAFNTELNKIVEADYENIPADGITPYSNIKLQKAGTPKSFTNIYNCSSHQLQGEGNFCPSCQQFSMSIMLDGLVD